MQKLHLVGFTTDHEGLIFSTRRGARSGAYVLAIDESVETAIEEHRARRAEDAAGADEAEAARPRVESSLSVKEIQARLRRGRSIAEVAKVAGVEPDWVERFAPPVLAERAQVVTTVQSMTLRRSRLGDSALPIGDAVRRQLADRGVSLTADELADRWSAFQVDDGRWAVQCTFRYRGRDQVVRFDLDEMAGTVVAADRLSGQLGYVAPAVPVTPRRPAGAPHAGPGKRSTVPRSRPAKERELAAEAMRKAIQQRAADTKVAARKRQKEREQAEVERLRDERAAAALAARTEREQQRAAAAAAKAAATKVRQEARARETAERQARAAQKAAEALQAKRAAEVKRTQAAAKKAAETERAKKAAAKQQAAVAKQRAAMAKKATAERAKQAAAKQQAAVAKQRAAMAKKAAAPAKQAPVAKQTPAARKTEPAKASPAAATPSHSTSAKAAVAPAATTARGARPAAAGTMAMRVTKAAPETTAAPRPPSGSPRPADRSAATASAPPAPAPRSAPAPQTSSAPALPRPPAPRPASPPRFTAREREPRSPAAPSNGAAAARQAPEAEVPERSGRQRPLPAPAAAVAPRLAPDEPVRAQFRSGLVEPASAKTPAVSAAPNGEAQLEAATNGLREALRKPPPDRPRRTRPLRAD